MAKLQNSNNTNTTISRAQNSRSLNGVQKNTVRVALATGATIATLLGAQTLAFLDRSAGITASQVDTPTTFQTDTQAQVSPANSVTDPNLSAISNVVVVPSDTTYVQHTVQYVPPTTQPTTQPTTRAVVQATIQPTVKPTMRPAIQPTAKPIVQPTAIKRAVVQPTPVTRSTRRG